MIVVSLDWQQLHELIGVSPIGESGGTITGVGSLETAGPGDISFLGNPRYESQLAGTAAGVFLVPAGDFANPQGSRLIQLENHSRTFSKVVDFFQSQAHSFEPGISPGAHLSPGVICDPELIQIGAGVVVETGTKIGDGTTISPGCLISRDVEIGKDCFLHPGVIIREGCRIGDRVILQPGCVIGSDGYGFEQVDGRHVKVPQVGIVEIEDEVEVGANACIDRARFGKTLIGEGTKIDNLVQIAHNVKIGKHCLIVAQSGIAGSSRLGNYVTIAAQGGVAGHLELADQSVLSAQSGLLKSISDSGVFMGTPARPMKTEQRKLASLARLPKLRQELQELKKKLEELTGE